MSTIHKDVLALSGKLAEHVKINAKGEVTLGEGNLYEDNLPEGVTKKEVAAVHGYDETFIAAASHAVGTKAIKSFKSHSALDKIETSIPMAGKNHLDLEFARKETFPNPAGGEPITRHGTMTPKYVVHAGRAKVGHLGAVRKLLAEEALKALGS